MQGGSGPFPGHFPHIIYGLNIERGSEIGIGKKM